MGAREVAVHAEKSTMDGGGEANDDRNDGGSNGDDAMKKKVMSPIAPAAMGRRGGEYVSTRTHPLAP